MRRDLRLAFVHEAKAPASSSSSSRSGTAFPSGRLWRLSEIRRSLRRAGPFRGTRCRDCSASRGLHLPRRVRPARAELLEHFGQAGSSFPPRSRHGRSGDFHRGSGRAESAQRDGSVRLEIRERDGRCDFSTGASKPSISATSSLMKSSVVAGSGASAAVVCGVSSSSKSWVPAAAGRCKFGRQVADFHAFGFRRAVLRPARKRARFAGSSATACWRDILAIELTSGSGGRSRVPAPVRQDRPRSRRLSLVRSDLNSTPRLRLGVLDFIRPWWTRSPACSQLRLQPEQPPRALAPQAQPRPESSPPTHPRDRLRRRPAAEARRGTGAALRSGRRTSARFRCPAPSARAEVTTSAVASGIGCTSGISNSTNSGDSRRRRLLESAQLRTRVFRAGAAATARLSRMLAHSDGWHWRAHRRRGRQFVVPPCPRLSGIAGEARRSDRRSPYRARSR